MKEFTVTVNCVMTEQSTIEVKAATQEEANDIIEKRLDGGWSEVFGDESGDLIECESEVVK